MSRIRVVIAYQPGHPSRLWPFCAVQEMFGELGWPVTIAAGLPGEAYNCGQSKNAGVRQDADPRPDDILVICDADCVTSEETLRESVWGAHSKPGIMWCGDTIRILDAETTDRLRGWRDAAAQIDAGELRPADSTPQLYAIRRDCFDELGGYDEAYVGYGFEDYDFRHRAQQHWPSRKAKGTLVHLWHEPSREKVQPGKLYEANHKRWLASQEESA